MATASISFKIMNNNREVLTRTLVNDISQSETLGDIIDDLVRLGRINITNRKCRLYT